MESVKDGLKIYDNPVGVMTNSPGFGFYLLNLANYMSLSRSDTALPKAWRLPPTAVAWAPLFNKSDSAAC